MPNKQPVVSKLSSGELDAIAEGHFYDIFSALGLHPDAQRGGLVARFYVPGADTVEMVGRESGKTLYKLSRIHDDGIFETVIHNRKQTFDFVLRCHNSGETWTQEDPYHFESCLNEDDLHYFNEGTHEHVWRWMGANQRQVNGVDGVLFVVWAPSALRVSLIGSFNHWDGRRHVMRKHPAAGIWEIFVPGVEDLALYKYEIIDANGNLLPLKADPYAKSMQHPPETASRVVYDRSYAWGDADWMKKRQQRHGVQQPISIYEVHAGSWRRADHGRYLSYRELAEQLIPYVLELGFTHIQLMPINEYPFDGSWGYQPVGMYAPTIRFGNPDEFRYFVDQCHQADLGVLIDWVPGHFPSDPHGLGHFDGSCLYEHMDRRQGFHPDWDTLIYNYGRGEVLSYLISNANYWLEEFHLDGLRVDAVASMLYLDYSRQPGEWIPNKFGGRENLEAIAFLRSVNRRVYANHPGVMMVAEESTAWPGVSRPVDQDGLGFGFKWNMGWMNDSLSYMSRDPVHRKYHHGEMTFSMIYAYDENFILSLSHDEVVHGKRTLLDKMPGDYWQKFANLRAYYGFMWTHPGKKLLFMGSEFGQWNEWNHDTGLDWALTEFPLHQGLQRLVRDLNQLYRERPAMAEMDCEPGGFNWLQCEQSETSVFAWVRYSSDRTSLLISVTNFTPVPQAQYHLGVPRPGPYRERINTDSELYGGSNVGNGGWVDSQDMPWDDQPHTLIFDLPPLATVIFEYCQA